MQIQGDIFLLDVVNTFACFCTFLTKSVQCTVFVGFLTQFVCFMLDPEVLHYKASNVLLDLPLWLYWFAYSL